MIRRPKRTPFTSLTATGSSVDKGLKYKLLDIVENGEQREQQDSLSSKEMIRKTILARLQAIVAFASLVKNHVDNFVLVADVFCGIRHEFVYNFAEKGNISTSIFAYSRYEFS